MRVARSCWSADFSPPSDAEACGRCGINSARLPPRRAFKGISRPRRVARKMRARLFAWVFARAQTKLWRMVSTSHERFSNTFKTNSENWFKPGQFCLILGACIFAAYPEVILGVRTFFFRDFGFFGYPLAFHHRESIWHGEIPLWNPLNNCVL